MPVTYAYERDPRLTRLDTEVVTVGEEEGRPFVVLADTILFPEGGGQPADRGTVGDVAVVDVRKVDGAIRHFLAGPPPSGRVSVALDWARRFDHMQQHTAQHLLTAVADRRLRVAHHGLPPRGADVRHRAGRARPRCPADGRAGGGRGRGDPRGPPVTARRVSPEEYAGLTVRSRGLPEGHTGDVRLVEIEGIDLNTCGGTHCASTAEIEALKLLGTESMRGGTRLSWVAGRRLRELHEAHHRRNAELRELLGTSDDELVARVGREARPAQGTPSAPSAGLRGGARRRGGGGARGGGRATSLVAHWPERDLPFLQRVAREVGRRAPDRVVLLTAGEGEEGAFLLAAGEEAGLDVAEAGRRVAELLEGRGGGSGRVFQGKAARLSRRADAAHGLETLP